MVNAKTVVLLMSLIFAKGAAAGPFERPVLSPSILHSIKLLAVQSGGRVKPFDTFAREGLELLTGRSSFQGRSAAELVLSMVAEPHDWEDVEIIEINHQALKRELGLNVEQKYHSPKQISGSPKLMSLFTELDTRKKNKVKLDPYWQAVQRLGNQLGLIHNVVSGAALTMVPPDEQTFKNVSDSWLNLERMTDEQKLRFTLILASFVNPELATRERTGKHADTFRQIARDYNPTLYPDDSHLRAEVLFNEIRPFRWGFIFALTALILLGLSFWVMPTLHTRMGMIFYLLSLGFQVYGFGMRCWLAGRPPVSNMYESIIWVSFGAMFFGLIFEIYQRSRISILSASFFGFLGLLVADNVGMLMDDSIQPLEPVLRSNLWLTIHVLTITLSYAAFAVSLVIGNIALGQFIFVGRETKNFPLKVMALHAYRAVQLGVVLLAAGTILGGVWADYSWGRFWGWDPKETWALIALLGYLALLHARFSGMVRAFGFLVGCVLAFMGVVMAWYGVNFVLGAGLHSYGFGAGGISYMASYVSLQVLFVVYASFLYRGQNAKLVDSSASSQAK